MASFEDWYKEIPVVTRTYLTLSFVTTGACALDLISPYSLYFNLKLVFFKFQVWRLFTNFFFFGSFGLDFLFHMFFLVKYSRLLEESNEFRGLTSAFFYMLLFGAIIMSCLAPFINIHFLGSSLTFMMVYVWGRRNDQVRMSFLALFQFTAPYLPWVLLAFSVLLGNSPVVDLMGIGVGHIYYFLQDVFPRMPASRGRRPLETPHVLKMIFGETATGAQIRGNFGGGGIAVGALPEGLPEELPEEPPEEQ